MATALGSGVLYEASTTGSGTGNYDSFLRLAANKDETGFNTDENQVLDNKDGIWTHSLQINTLDTITDPDTGIEYYVIRLDLNEIQSGDSPNITLDDLQIFRSDDPATSANYSSGTLNLTKVFDLGTPLNLVDTNHGSGTDDYVFYIPVSLFPDSDQYFTLYADFSGSDDGFEEFRALSSAFVAQPDIGVSKETNDTDGDCKNILVGETVTWTYTVENNGNVPLHNVVLTDDNGTTGTTSDDFNPDPVLGADNQHNIGDINNDGILDTNETWLFTATGPAIAGEYKNVATVSGEYTADSVVISTVTGTGTDCYYGASPAIEVVKSTNGKDGDCPIILAGDTVTWSYDVTNTGDIALSNIAVVDDNGDGFGNGNDFSATYVSGDDGNGVLDPGETWHYTATGVAGAGEYDNVANVIGYATDDFSNVATVTDTETDCYFGGAPAVSILKETNGTDDKCPVVAVGETVTWTYEVTNTGNISLNNVVVTDDNGDGFGNGNDFNPTYVSGDDGNGLLDPGETWLYRATGTAQLGHYDNVAVVTAYATDDFAHSTSVSATEDDCYVGLEGPCPRTPGFWSHWTDFWDGDAHVPVQAGQDDFPTGDLLLQHVDSDNNGSLDALGLLVGDFNKNGITDDYGLDGIAGNGDDFQEDTLFISYDNAIKLINASNKQMNDGVVKVGRDVVATWLNYLMGSPIDDLSDTNSPAHFIQAAVNYLQTFGDQNSSNTYVSGETFDKYCATHTAVKTSSPYWNNNVVGDSGAAIHSALDVYNNTGTINGIIYAPSCDNPQFLEDLRGYALDGALFLN